MLIFKNKEEIDVRGITTFGTSSKNNDKAIGFFGTGLKYAIAVLLREGCSIKIYSGFKKYEFCTKKTQIRNNEFDVVIMKSGSKVTELAFTTELGKNWELWQAYRELYCNCIDENGEVNYLIVPKVTPQEGTTKIVVEGLDEVHEKRGDFILTSQPIYDLEKVEMHPLNAAGKGAIFYRGIKVFQPEGKMLYSYNLKEKQDLTEDRTLKYYYMATRAIVDSIVGATIADPIIDLVTAEKDSYEANIDWSWAGIQPKETFLGVMKTHEKTTLSFNSYRYYSGYALENLEHLPRLPLSKLQADFFSQVKMKCLSLGYEDIYPIVLTDMLADNECTKAGDETIYVSDKIFMLEEEKVVLEVYKTFMVIKHGDNAINEIIKKLMEVANETVTAYTFNANNNEPF